VTRVCGAGTISILSGNNEEFGLYCQGKPADARERLGSVREPMLDAVPEVSEGRVHF